MTVNLSEWVDLENVFIQKACVMCISKNDIPANPTSEAYYVIYVFLMGMTTPLSIPFAKEEDRDNAYAKIKSEIARIPTDE